MVPRKHVDRIGRTLLARAADEGDLAKVLNQLSLNPEHVNEADNAGNTPLQMAACKGHAKIVHELIQAGAQVNTTNIDGDTPLKDAKDNDHKMVIDLLENAGAEVKAKSVTAKTFPRHRLLYQQTNLQQLLEYIKSEDTEGIGYCLEAQVKPDNECMVQAVMKGNSEILGLLLAFGGNPDPDPVSVGLRTPVLTAINAGNTSMVLLLFDSGADPLRRVASNQMYQRYARINKVKNLTQMNTILKNASFSAGKLRDSECKSMAPPQTVS